jgi:hypothetical protein
MEQQLNNKNGGFGDILFFCFFFLMQNFFFKIKSTKNTHKQTNRKERERERERFGTEHTSTTSNL